MPSVKERFRKALQQAQQIHGSSGQAVQIAGILRILFRDQIREHLLYKRLQLRVRRSCDIHYKLRKHLLQVLIIASPDPADFIRSQRFQTVIHNHKPPVRCPDIQLQLI